jgi:hypothetical protein
MSTLLCPRVVGSNGARLILCDRLLPCPDHGQPVVVTARPASPGPRTEKP